MYFLNLSIKSEIALVLASGINLFLMSIKPLCYFVLFLRNSFASERRYLNLKIYGKIMDSNIIEKFIGKRVLVVGDIILDKYIFGDAERISPEAPIPVVNVKKVEYRLGGAANVANNLKFLRAKPILVGCIGDDENGKILINALSDIENYLLKTNKPTTTKTRVISNKQQIVRFDKEDKTKVRNETEENAIKYIKEAMSVDAVILSDYAKGFLTKKICQEVINLCKKSDTPIIVDPKDMFSKYKGATIITPNKKELHLFSNNKSDEEEIAKEVIKDNGLEALLLTKGDKGMSLFKKDGKVLDVPALCNGYEVVDVTGAGDTVIAVLSLSFASGIDFENATILANHAAGLVVRKLGTSYITFEELKKYIESEKKEKIKELDELVKIVRELKESGKKIVTTNGCFDLLHIGHIRYLKEAKKLGDILIVGLNSDESVKKLKGNERPVIPAKERMEILAGLESVDYVFVFDELDPRNWLEKIKPHIHVKGGDYSLNEIIEKDVVEKNGGKVIILGNIENKSTTSIIKKIKGEK